MLQYSCSYDVKIVNAQQAEIILPVKHICGHSQFGKGEWSSELWDI
jgi:hypothetical protein